MPGHTITGVCRPPRLILPELHRIFVQTLGKQNESSKSYILLFYVGAKFQHILLAGHFKLVREPKILHLHLKKMMRKKISSSVASSNPQSAVTPCAETAEARLPGPVQLTFRLRLQDLPTSPFLPLLRPLWLPYHSNHAVSAKGALLPDHPRSAPLTSSARLFKHLLLKSPFSFPP